MTEAEQAELNTALLPAMQAVIIQSHDAPAPDTYQLCQLVPVKDIEDIVAFGASKGVVIAP